MILHAFYPLSYMFFFCNASPLSRVLFPPHIDRSSVKGAHLVSPDFIAGRDSHSTMSEEDIGDAMEAVHYFTYSLDQLRRQHRPQSPSQSPRSDLAPVHHCRRPPFDMVEFLQFPGETVFIPHGWLHAVINLTPTIAVTQNYVGERNFQAVWKDARLQRPHMSERWREQLRRHEFSRADSNLARLLSEVESEEPLRSMPPFKPSSTRLPDIDYIEAAHDPESWYWEPSSSEEEEEEDEDDGGGEEQLSVRMRQLNEVKFDSSYD